MRRELYIAGLLADINDISIPLNFACSEIADLTGVSGNYSLTIKLPLTNNNIQIANHCQNPNTTPESMWDGFRNTASYFVDGIPIFQNATAKILGTETSIDVSVTFGNLTWLDVLENLKLKDIGLTSVKNWNYWIFEDTVSDGVLWPLVNYGGTFENKLHAERLHPAINVHHLWSLIWFKLRDLGVIGEETTDIENLVESDLYMPIMSQVINPLLSVGADFSMDTDLLITDENTEYNVSNLWDNFDYTTDNPGIVFDNAGRWFIIPKDGKYHITINSNAIIETTAIGHDLINFNIALRNSRENGDKVISANQFPAHGTGIETFPIVYDGIVDLKKGDVMYLQIQANQSGDPGYACNVHLDNNANIFSLFYVQNPDKKEQLEFFMPYDINHNLPDISCKDFVKAIMQLYGLLVENNNDPITNIPVFFNLSELNTTESVDWSDKLVNFKKPKIDWNLGLKQTNYLKYLPDETDNVIADGSFTTYENDLSEKTVFTSLFAASEDVELVGTSFFELPVCSVPMWVEDDKTGWKYEGKCKQRIFRTDNSNTFSIEVVQLYGEDYTAIYATNENTLISWFKTLPAGLTDTGQALDMASIILKYYPAYIKAVKSNRLFTFQMLFDAVDINRFSHRKPAYVSHFANYYFIKKILNWEANKVCNVEVLMMKDLLALPAPLPALELTWDDIANVPVANASSVSDWNTFFDLPTWGALFTSVEIVGNLVKLLGGENIILYANALYFYRGLIDVNDSGGVIIGAGDSGFGEDSYLQRAILGKLAYCGSGFFEGCFSLNEIYIPLCADLGTSVLNNSVFGGIVGNTITITIPSVLMACNGGAPDGDIAYLIANNTVTIFDPDGIQLYP